jgi:ribose transport system permease protein
MPATDPGSIEITKKNTNFFNRILGVFKNTKTPIPTLIVFYILMVVVFSLVSPNYLSVTNLKSILSNLPVNAILAAGTALVMIGGGFDLSIGSIMGLVGIIIVNLFNIGFDLPIPVIIIIALMLSSTLGFINGLIISRIGINPIITTLGTMAVFRGICYFWAGSVKRINSEAYLSIGRGFIGNAIPYTFIYILAIFILMALFLKYTKYGRNVYIIGGNENIAKIFGVNVKNTKVVSYIISGLFAGIAAVILTAQLGSGRPEYGQGVEIDIITIVVLGGVTIGGGKGNYLGTFIALLLISSISNGLVLMDVPIYWRIVIKGFLLILAVSIDAIRNRKRMQLY